MSSTSPTFLPRPFSPALGWSSKFGLLGVCLYIAGFALPLKWDIFLLVLALFSAFAFITRSRTSTTTWSALALLVVVFLAATALSTLMSVDRDRSIRLGIPPRRPQVQGPASTFSAYVWTKVCFSSRREKS
jgi:hypothetical protein